MRTGVCICRIILLTGASNNHNGGGGGTPVAFQILNTSCYYWLLLLGNYFKYESTGLHLPLPAPTTTHRPPFPTPSQPRTTNTHLMRAVIGHGSSSLCLTCRMLMAAYRSCGCGVSISQNTALTLTGNTCGASAVGHSGMCLSTDGGGVWGVRLWACGWGGVRVWGCRSVGLWGCGGVGVWGCGAVGK